MFKKIAIPAVLLALLLIALPMAQTQTQTEDPQTQRRVGLPVPSPSVNSEFVVSWPALQGIIGYQLQYRTTAMDWTARQLAHKTSTSHAFAGMPAGDYQVRVRSNTFDRFSDWSSPITVSIPKPPPPKLPGTDNISHNGFVITWDAVANAVGYKISVKGIRPRRIAGSWVDVTTNSYTIPNGQYGQMYAVLVQTVGDGVTGAVDSWFNTNPYFMTPQAPPPTAVPTAVPTNEPTAVPQQPRQPQQPDNSNANSNAKPYTPRSKSGGCKYNCAPESDDPPKKPQPQPDPIQPPAPVCQSSIRCAPSSGTWTTSFENKDPNGDGYSCKNLRVTRTLQQFTCRDTCTNAVTSTETRILSESIFGPYRGPC